MVTIGRENHDGVLRALYNYLLQKWKLNEGKRIGHEYMEIDERQTHVMGVEAS